MLFWPILIIGTVVLAVFVALSPTLTLPGSEYEQMRAIYLSILLVLILSGGIGRLLLRGGRRTLVNMAVWIGVFAVFITGYSFRNEAAFLWHRLRGELVPSLALSRSIGEVELRRAWDGHYRADARINGKAIRLMIDTGASMVLIPFEEAAGLGIDPTRLRFSMPVATANGESAVAPVQLARVEIGSIVVKDVVAAVAPEGRLQGALLGMSFLERLTETTFRGDRLILKQSAGDREDLIFTSPGRG